MLNWVFSLLLCLSLRSESRFHLLNQFLQDVRHFSIRVKWKTARNKCTCSRFKEWYKTVFRMNSKSVGREAESQLECPPVYMGLRRLSKLARSQLKLFSSGGTFWSIWVSQPLNPFCYVDSKVRMLQLDGDSKSGNFIWLQLILGPKPCFLRPIQLVTQKVNIH